MKLRLVPYLALLSFGLAACVTTTPTHNLSDKSVRALRLERVEVSMSNGMQITWPGLMEEVTAAESKRTGTEVTDPRTIPRVVHAEMLSRFRTHARTALEPALRTRLSGSKPVVARVTMHHVFVPTTGGVIISGLLGGANAAGAQSSMSASIDFVDARTGATIVSYPKTAFQTQGAQKLNMGTSGSISHDPIERMFANMGGEVAAWLTRA